MANLFIVTGNLVREPETSTTQGGVQFTRFQIACNRQYANSNGEKLTDYFDIATWRGLAETCAKYLHKGSKVYVQGEMQQRHYEDKNGVKKTSYQVVADKVEFLSIGSKNNQKPSENDDEPQPVNSDDLPF